MKVRVFPKTRQHSKVHIILARCKTADSAGREKRSGSCWYADNVNIREQGKSNELDSAARSSKAAAACPTVAPFLSENREQPRGPGVGFMDAPSCLPPLNVVIGVYSLLVPDSACRVQAAPFRSPRSVTNHVRTVGVGMAGSIFFFNAYACN